MRRLALVALGLLLANPARAEALAWEGTLSLDLLGAGLEPPSLTGADVAIALPDASGWGLQTLRVRGGITDGTVFLVTDPDTLGQGIAAVALDATLGIATLQPFQPPASLLQPQLTLRTLPVGGALRLCILSAACTSAVSLPLTLSGSRGVGIGGLVTAGPGALIRLSLEGAPWTLRTAWVSVTTASGSMLPVPAFGAVHGPLSFTGSTLATGGSLKLVTPIAVTSEQGPGPSGFGTLRLRFLPEPGLLLLVSSGCAGLLTLGRRRLRP